MGPLWVSTVADADDAADPVAPVAPAPDAYPPDPPEVVEPPEPPQAASRNTGAASAAPSRTPDHVGVRNVSISPFSPSAPAPVSPPVSSSLHRGYGGTGGPVHPGAQLPRSSSSATGALPGATGRYRALPGCRALSGKP